VALPPECGDAGSVEIGGSVSRTVHYQERRIIMTIVRWSPTRDVAALEEGLSRMLEGFYRRPQEDLNRGAWVPVVDIYSNDQHELVLKAELPDMKEEEIELTIEDSSIASSAIMVPSQGPLRCRRRSTQPRSAPSTRPAC
jgi:hypothetical protein